MSVCSSFRILFLPPPLSLFLFLSFSIILLLLLLLLCYRAKRHLRVHNAVGTYYTYIYIKVYQSVRIVLRIVCDKKKTHKKLHKKTVCEFHWKMRVLQITANTEERPACRPTRSRCRRLVRQFAANNDVSHTISDNVLITVVCSLVYFTRYYIPIYTHL